MPSQNQIPNCWRKSSFSAEDANCVEVAAAAEAIRVRDSKQPTGPVLAFSPGPWARLLEHVAG